MTIGKVTTSRVTIKAGRQTKQGDNKQGDDKQSRVTIKMTTSRVTRSRVTMCRVHTRNRLNRTERKQKVEEAGGAEGKNKVEMAKSGEGSREKIEKIEVE